MAGRKMPWQTIGFVLGGLLVVVTVLCYLWLHQPMVGFVALVLAGLILSWAIGGKRTPKQRWHFLIALVLAGSFLAVTSLGRHQYTGRITAVSRVNERHGDYHYAVTLKAAHHTYHLVDEVNLVVGKSALLRLRPGTKPLTVTVAGLWENRWLPQNILTVR